MLLSHPPVGSVWELPFRAAEAEYLPQKIRLSRSPSPCRNLAANFVNNGDKIFLWCLSVCGRGGRMSLRNFTFSFSLELNSAREQNSGNLISMRSAPEEGNETLSSASFSSSLISEPRCGITARSQARSLLACSRSNCCQGSDESLRVCSIDRTL